MGKLDVKMMRYLTAEDFRVLTAVEMGMKNHELITITLVAQIANLHHGGLHKILQELCKHRLLSFEHNKHYEGYRLTNTGYDYLALKALTTRGIIDRFGNQIGVGKESNIYLVSNKDSYEVYCLKLHRLGRTCFRQIKNKRYYHENRKYMSWLYLSRISATKEFAYMKSLYERGFPVPKPIDFNRHCIIMELIDGTPLCNVHEIKNKENLYDELMKIICELACCGVIHGDFNEFNILITPQEKPIIIDFPQMIPVEHEEAEMYFNRDVKGIRDFFRKRFDYESIQYPIFKNIIKELKQGLKINSKVIVFSPVMSEEESQDNQNEKIGANKISEKILSHLNITDIKSEDSKLEKNLTNLKDVFKLESNKNYAAHEEREQRKHNHKMKRTLTQEVIRQRVKVELLKCEKKERNKKNLKKSTILTKNRREVEATARENVGF